MVRCAINEKKANIIEEQKINNQKEIRLTACKNICKKENKDCVAVRHEVKPPVLTCECVLHKGTEFINIQDPI